MRKYMILLFSIGVTLSLYGCNQKETASNKQIQMTIEDKVLDQTTQLNYQGIHAVSANDDSVFLSVDDHSPSEMPNKVVEFNRKTQKNKTLFTTTFDHPFIQEVKSNKDWVVWIDSDQFGGQMNYYAMNIKTQKIELIKQMDDSELLDVTLELTGHRVVWVTHHKEKDEAHIFMRDLSKKQTKKLFKLTKDYSHLSVYEDKLLFFNQKNEKMHAYIYNFTTEELQEVNLNHDLISDGKLLNDHQFLYEKSFTDSEGAIYQSQLLFYDMKTKQTKPITKKERDGSGSIVVDDQKQILLYREGSGEEGYFIFKEENGSIKDLGKLKGKSHYDLAFDNGLYLLHQNHPEKNQKLIITSKLP
ncbi:hypothetical protein [Bacillus sp. 179-C3.3 HS]|uniref:hypothetical protein n=1 Tax=Bacillus sp. 179-C3.3 HS TaxID=3232162 RepID=UPI0039A36746